MTRYKIGKLERPIACGPGCTLHLELDELAVGTDGITRVVDTYKVSEPVGRTVHVTHWVLFWVPGFAVGGMFVEDVSLVSSFFGPWAVHVPSNEPLIPSE